MSEKRTKVTKLIEKMLADLGLSFYSPFVMNYVNGATENQIEIVDRDLREY